MAAPAGRPVLHPRRATGLRRALWFGVALVVLGLGIGLLPFTVDMPLALDGSDVSVSCSGPLVSAWHSTGAFRPPGATSSGGTVSTTPLEEQMEALRKSFLEHAKGAACAREARTLLWRPVGVLVAGVLAFGVLLVISRRHPAAPTSLP